MWVVQGAGPRIVTCSRVAAAVLSVAIANETVGAGFDLQHEGKILCAHGGLLVEHLVSAHQIEHHLPGKRSFI